MTVVDRIAGDSAEYEQHGAECAKSRIRIGGHSVWRGNAEKEAKFEGEKGISNSRRGVLIAAKVS